MSDPLDPLDDFGHGTEVSGVIGAVTNNSKVNAVTGWYDDVPNGNRNATDAAPARHSTATDSAILATYASRNRNLPLSFVANWTRREPLAWSQRSMLATPRGY